MTFVTIRQKRADDIQSAVYVQVLVEKLLDMNKKLEVDNKLKKIRGINV